MAKEDKVTTGNDFLDMDDFSAGVEPAPTTEDLSTNVLQVQPQGDDWDSILARLTSYCDKAWICTKDPEDETKFVITELANCTSEEFCKWVNQVYPPSSKLPLNAQAYSRYSDREREFWKVFEYTQKNMRFFGPKKEDVI